MSELEKEMNKRKGLPFDDDSHNDWPEPVDTCSDEYRKLLDQILKGAEYIASIDETDPNWQKANEKYNKLCGQAFLMRDK